jgi:hypothetical protein
MLERKLIFFSHNHPASIHCFLFGGPVKASEAQSLRLREDIISFSSLKHLRIARMTKKTHVFNHWPWMCLQVF